MFLDQIPNYKPPLKGYLTNTHAYHQFLRLGRVVYYDPILKHVNIAWIDGFGGGTTNVEVGSSSAGGSVYSGVGPSVGDIVLIAKGRENFGTGRPYVVAVYPTLGEANRTNAFVYDDFEERYEFSYSKSPEGGDPYHKSRRGSELHLTQDVYLNNSSMSRLEMLASQDMTHLSSRSLNFYGSGVWGNVGLAHRPMSFLNSAGSGITSLNKNEYDVAAEKNIQSAIKSLSLEDGTFLYAVTPNDSEKTSDESEDTKVYSEFDFLISETHELEPVAMNSSDLISEEFTKPLTEEGKGHLSRFGFGTKIGRNASDKKTYAIPLKRNIFKGSSEDKADKRTTDDKDELETETVNKDQPLKDEDSVSLFSTAFWFNLFKKDKEVGFIEMLKNGALRIFCSSVDGTGQKNNAVEGNIDGRIKLKVGKQEGVEQESSNSSGLCPVFNEWDDKPRGDSVTAFLDSGVNLFVNDKDSKNNGFQMLLNNQSNLKIKATGDSDFQVDGEERVYVKGKSTGTYDETTVRRFSKNSVSMAKGANTIQGLPISLALSAASFDSCGDGGFGNLTLPEQSPVYGPITQPQEGDNSSGNLTLPEQSPVYGPITQPQEEENSSSNGLIQLGIGSTVNSETGALEGGKVVKAEPDNTTNPTKLTFDFAGLSEIVFQNYGTVKFLGNVEVGAGAQEVAIKGSTTLSAGGGFPHVHTLGNDLSSALKASKSGGSTGNTNA